MTQLKSWIMVGPAQPSVWSQAITLQQPEPDSPAWFICISLQNGSSSTDDGQEAIHQLGQAYEHSSAKSSDELLKALKPVTGTHPHLNILGLHFNNSQVTCFSYGRAEVHLAREGQSGIILENTESVWKQTTGTLQPNDALLLATNSTHNDYPNFQPLLDTYLSPETRESTVEEVQTSISSGMALISCRLIPAGSPETASSPIPDSKPSAPQPNLWHRLFSRRPKQAETPAIIAKRRRAIYAGWLVLGLLVTSVLLGSRTRDQRRLGEQFAVLDQKIKEDIAAAQALQTVDQVQARQILRDSKNRLDETKANFAKHDNWAKQVFELETYLNSIYDSIAAEAALSEIPTWFSLSVIKSGMQGNIMKLSGNDLLILDKTTGTLVELDTNAKRAEIIAGGDTVQAVIDLTIIGRQVFLLKASGIDAVNLSNKNVSSVITAGSDWQQPGLINSFNNNLYVIDPQAGLIWRYSTPTQDSASQQPWLGPGVSLPGSTYSDSAIDGDVWLIEDGKISRYRRGAPVTFTLSGMDEPLSSSTPSMAVSSDTDKIFVLDQGKGRIVQLDKTGAYVKQVKWAGLTKAQSIAVTGDGNSLFILREGTIHLLTP